MSARRNAILAEMGLAPIWRERKRDLALPSAQDSAPQPTEGSPRAQQPVVHSSSAPTSLVPDGATPAVAREARIRGMDWRELKLAVPACTACGLHKGRTQTVFGVGDENADWLLVGEAPGAEEDRLGEPFVGQAGRLLDNMLAALDLMRGRNVYIANVLKCRPPANRNPAPEEIAQCAPHLLRQIALIKPKLILAMGRFAVQTLLNTEASISSLRGRVHRYAGVPLVVTYHPAYLLRSLPEKAKAWEDLVFAKRTIAGGA
jgi:uracil-DNA glycosylase